MQRWVWLVCLSLAVLGEGRSWFNSSVTQTTWPGVRSSENVVVDVCVDDNGDTYMVMQGTQLLQSSAVPQSASVNGSIVFGKIDGNVFVSKYDSEGRLVWLFGVGSDGNDVGQFCALDHTQGLLLVAFSCAAPDEMCVVGAGADGLGLGPREEPIGVGGGTVIGTYSAATGELLGFHVIRPYLVTLRGAIDTTTSPRGLVLFGDFPKNASDHAVPVVLAPRPEEGQPEGEPLEPSLGGLNTLIVLQDCFVARLHLSDLPNLPTTLNWQRTVFGGCQVCADPSLCPSTQQQVFTSVVNGITSILAWGHFMGEGTITLPGDTPTVCCGPTKGSFLMLYSLSGGLLWGRAFTFGGNPREHFTAVTLTANAIVTSGVCATSDPSCDGGTLRIYNLTGDLTWSSPTTPMTNDPHTALDQLVTLDITGDVVVARTGGADLGPISGCPPLPTTSTDPGVVNVVVFDARTRTCLDTFNQVFAEGIVAVNELAVRRRSATPMPLIVVLAGNYHYSSDGDDYHKGWLSSTSFLVDPISLPMSSSSSTGGREDPPSSSTGDPETDPGSDSGNSAGAIAGAVVGALAGLLCVVLGVWYWRRQQQRFVHQKGGLTKETSSSTTSSADRELASVAVASTSSSSSSSSSANTATRAPAVSTTGVVMQERLCMECESQPAQIRCDECDQSLCVGCSVSIHKTGKRARHVLKQAAALVSRSALQQDLQFADLKLGGKVGEGNSAVVCAALWRGTDVAVKQPKRTTPAAVAELRREAEMCVRVGHHPRVVPFFGAGFEAGHPFLLFELMPNGSVEELLIAKQTFPLAGPALSDAQRLEHLRILLQLACDSSSAILHLHKQRMVHRDIASRNFLVNAQQRVFVADFGMSVVLAAGAQSFQANATDELLPLAWCAPEVLQRRTFSPASDTFAFGVYLFELIAQREPYLGTKDLQQVCTDVVDKHTRPTLPAYCPRELAVLIHQCWDASPDKRPTMEAINEALRGLWTRYTAAPTLGAVYAPLDQTGTKDWTMAVASAASQQYLQTRYNVYVSRRYQ